MDKKLFYFGCNGEKGHFLWDGNYNITQFKIDLMFSTENTSFFKFIDGVYPPNRNEIAQLYQEVNIGVFKIVAWWDRSFDHRFASNSALIGYGYDNAEEMIDDMKIYYPTVYNRQPRPTKYIK